MTPGPDPVDTPARRAYERSLESLRVEVRTLGNQVLMLLVDAFEQGRRDTAHERLEVLLAEVLADVDRLEDDCFALLARQQPVAADLRGILGALAVVGELDECARQAVDLARDMAGPLVEGPLPGPVRDLVAVMSAQASVELSLALEAFSEASAPIAQALRDVDDVMDGLQRDLYRTLADRTPADDRALACLVRAALAGSVLERMGDSAVECADRVLFWVTGEAPKPRAEGDAPAGQAGSSS